MDAYGIERIMSPLKEGDLAPMRAAVPEVPTGGLTTVAREVSLLVGHDNYGVFPSERRCRTVREPVRNRVDCLGQATSGERRRRRQTSRSVHRHAIGA